MMVFRLIVIVILLCLVGSGVADALWNNHLGSHITTTPPQLEVSYVDDEVTAEVPNDYYITDDNVDIDRTVNESIVVQNEITVEKIVEKPIEFREFASLSELCHWLELDETDSTIDCTEKEDLANLLLTYVYDCDDFAYNLQKNALSQGYLMSTEIVIKDGEQHMINSTTIGNNIYFIEPQTDEVWLGTYRD